MKIQNYEDLVVTPERRIALEIIEAGLAAIDTNEVMRRIRIERGLLRFPDHDVELSDVERIFVIAIGKCAIDAAGALEELLGGRLTSGIAIDVRLPGQLAGESMLKKLEVYVGTHPLPSERNIDLTKKIIAMLSGLTERDLVIFIVSGGGSTLLCQPGNFTCFEEVALIDCLMKSGADILEINTVRKHLSLARGGYLAKYAYPAQVVSLIFSDVPGGDLEFVASGPTILDTTSIADAVAVLQKYSTGSQCGFHATQFIETPKNEKYFLRVKNILFVSNTLALEAMAEAAARRGFAVRICSTCLSGEAREVGREIAAAVKNEPAGTILFYGGETTVTVRGVGKGGRNLELALAALPILGERELLVAIASDGRDNTDFAGAISDQLTKREIAALGFDPVNFLAGNSSFDFWSQTRSYILTGHTGSNVADLSFVIKFK